MGTDVKLEFKSKLYNINNLINQNSSLFKDDLDCVINDLMGLFKYSYLLDINDDRDLIYMFYNVVYDVIKKEIELCGSTVLLDYCRDSSFDSNILEGLIINDVSSLGSYSSIIGCYYRLMNDNKSLLDKELITLICYKDIKDKISKDMFGKIKDNNDRIDSLIRKREDEVNRLRKYREELIDTYESLFRKLCALAISFSIPINAFFLTKNFIRSNSYEKVTKTYNSYTDSVSDRSSYVYSFNPSEDSKIYAVSYKSDDMYYVNKKTYDLSYLGFDSIEDYINYYRESNNLVLIDDRRVSRYDVGMNGNVDYFEIVYSYVSNEMVNEDTSFGVIVSFLVSFLIIVSSFNLVGDLKYAYKFEFDLVNEMVKNLFKYKVLTNNQRYEVKRLTGVLLNIIKDNEELKLKFNSELSNHKDIIDILDYDVISESKDLIKRLK